MRIGRFRLSKKRLFLALVLLLVAISFIYFATFNREILDNKVHSTIFYDCNNIPLRTYFSESETYCQPCKIADISPHFLRAIVLIEDKHFYSHKGVRLSSIARALWQNIKKRRIVSGGSTISMQLAKVLKEHRQRNIFNKIAEFFYALKLEVHLSKTQILAEYVNRLPFGNLVYGVKEAARFYFNKPPDQLSLNQAIFLALIPKSPAKYNPKTHLKHLKLRWKMILNTFRQQKHISYDEYSRAKREGIGFYMQTNHLSAPHFIDFVKEKYFAQHLPPKVMTTLDSRLQQSLQGIVREHLIRLQKFQVTSAAFVVIDNHSHQVKAYMGSPDYFNDKISGYVDVANSLRQPGSTLKPFVYGVALENGYNAATILPDIRFPSKGGFFPKNHDGKEHGPVRLRRALACSYNIPAFYLAMKCSPQQIIDKLRLAGFKYLRQSPGFYGETIALGSGEVKLIDLTIAYSAFANQGVIHFPAFLKGQPVKTQSIFKEKTAFLIWHILADPAARFASFGYNSSMNLPFPVAIKSGTSKGFRDKWAIGVNSEYTIGVWIGNPGGEDMGDLTRTGSAPTILRDLFLAVQKDWTQGEIQVPSGLIKRTICPLSGGLATENCPDAVEEYFDENDHSLTPCTYHLRRGRQVVVQYPELYKEWALDNKVEDLYIVARDHKKWISFPQNGDVFYLNEAISGQDQQITFEVLGLKEGEPVEFYLNGKLYKKVRHPQQVLFPLQRGQYRLTCKSNDETLDSIRFLVR